MIIDISQEVFSCQVYPGDPVPQLHALKRMEDGECFNLSALSMCVHNGTHIDAPAHFLADGKTAEQLALSVLIGACRVVHHPGILSADDARALCDFGRRERLLFSGDTVVTEEAAAVLVRAGTRLIGVDSQSVGDAGAPMAVHKLLLGADVVLLEGLVLSHVSPGDYTLCALPLKLAGCEGAPCRAVLLTEED